MPVDRTPNERFREARLRMNLTQDDLVAMLHAAGWAACDRRTIQRYESGATTRPQTQARRTLPLVLRTSMAELGFPDIKPLTHDEDVKPRDEEPGTPVGRREVLQSLAALGVAASPISEALRRVNADVDASLGIDDRSHVDDWGAVLVEYGYLYLMKTPSELLDDLAADLVAVQEATKRSTTARRRDWARITAELSELMARTLSNLDRPREARPWWSTGQRAAKAAGDTDLVRHIGAEQLLRGIYERRPMPLLMAQADELAKAGETTGPGSADLRSVRSQLMAMAGRPKDAQHEFRLAGQVFEQLPPEVTANNRTIHRWSEDRLTYVEVWMHAHAGNRNPLDDAISRAHAALPRGETRTSSQLGLMQAFGHIRGGDVKQGIRQAAAVYAAHPARQRTTLITSLATRALHAVPPAQRALPSVTQYGELLGISA